MKNITGSDHCMEIELARVLLVDDNPASRLTLQTVLEASGYKVDAAASAAEGRCLAWALPIIPPSMTDWPVIMLLRFPECKGAVLPHGGQNRYQKR